MFNSFNNNLRKLPIESELFILLQQNNSLILENNVLILNMETFE